MGGAVYSPVVLRLRGHPRSAPGVAGPFASGPVPRPSPTVSGTRQASTRPPRQLPGPRRAHWRGRPAPLRRCL